MRHSEPGSVNPIAAPPGAAKSGAPRYRIALAPPRNVARKRHHVSLAPDFAASAAIGLAESGSEVLTECLRITARTNGRQGPWLFSGSDRTPVFCASEWRRSPMARAVLRTAAKRWRPFTDPR